VAIQPASSEGDIACNALLGLFLAARGGCKLLDGYVVVTGRNLIFLGLTEEKGKVASDVFTKPPGPVGTFLDSRRPLG